MRIFKDFIEAHKEIEREIKHNGIVYQSNTVQDKDVEENENFLTKELIGYSFLVRNPDTESYISFLELNRKWLADEFIERISQSLVNPGKAWMSRENMWKEFLEDDGTFSYTYSERIGRQIEDVISLLENVPFTRHAIITIYNSEIDNLRRDGKRRVPCSMYYNLFLRDEGGLKLHLIYNIRSNDFVNHFPYDIVLARNLQEYIAMRVDVPIGDFIYQGGSLHVFHKDNEEIF
ncbi:MAG: hypothetical protein EHM34_06640 [Nitrosopumilales archaeon]|nr:MAG: hypothetical protein EHM34_06640 [Nitrosopumilales archaeon]